MTECKRDEVLGLGEYQIPSDQADGATGEGAAFVDPGRARGSFWKAGGPGGTDRSDRALRNAYEEVDRRDSGVCQVTGQYVGRSGEHHHIQRRSTHPERWADPRNIVTVSRTAHECLTRHWLRQRGTDALSVRFAWAPDAPHWARQAVIICQGRQAD